MKFIKKFEKDTEYVSYRNGKGYIKPNVSLSRDTKEVHYNYPIWDANGHEYVDLGLPSGTLWATCNVAATKPTAPGFYFQWGDTQGYNDDQVGKNKQFTWADYKFSINGSDTKFSKYKTTGATLDLEDDVAHFIMRGDWHMPSQEQISELLSNTTKQWTTLSDGVKAVNGFSFASKNDKSKSIFIPAAGSASEGSLRDAGSNGYIWSSILSGNVGYGEGLSFSSSILTNISGFRYVGFSVRGVLG